MDYQRVIDLIDDLIVNRTKYVLAAFLVVTAVFSLGLGATSTETGTDQFTQDMPAQEALDQVEEKFEYSFEGDDGSTQLIQSGENVVSKQGILRMLRAQKRMSERESLRVESANSAARVVATTLDPSASTLEEQIDAVESATPSEVRSAVRDSADNIRFTSLLSKDFNSESASASAALGIVTHRIPSDVSGGSGGGGGGGSSPMTDIQLRSQDVVNSVGGNIRVFGSGIINDEFANVITDSLIIVVPAASVLILVFLVVAYRDPFDLFLGIVSLGMAIVWTFGYMGLAGIPFSQMLIAVPPLLLAVGIDFGIHAVNRYREERVAGNGVDESMRTATDQLLVAFFIVAGTTVLGFWSNTTSALGPIRDFGRVAAVGIIFTTLIFGIFLPAAKLYIDRFRERRSLPEFGSQPLGSEDSVLGKILPIGARVSRPSPELFLALILVLTAGTAYYGTGVDTSFSRDDFLPPEDVSPLVRNLPEPFAPSEYTVTETTNYLEEKFKSNDNAQVTVYVEGHLEDDSALENVVRASQNPPETFLSQDRRARGESIVTVIRQYARESESFGRLVARNDQNSNGVPDDNLDEIYDALLTSPYRDRALDYITEDRRSMRVVYSVEGDASDAEVTEDARSVADNYRFDATATGQTVVFEAVSDVIFESALRSLALALGATAVFLVIVYSVIEGRPSLGIANLVPVVVTLALIAASMRYLGVSFNAMTATILSITIGLGVDYSVHTTHRFVDEYDESHDTYAALFRTLRGTGGALTGSMLTTTTGIGVLVLAITPILGQFGLMTGLSVFYSYLTSVIVLPPTLVLWTRYESFALVGSSDEV
ncbi:MAG: MMPL family transporter [Halobacteria archaeon]|nr:MMPL family transporter [Halobacteria archaeon]